MRMRAAMTAILGALTLAAASHGQGTTSWSMFSSEDFRPEIDEADIAVIVTALELGEDEREMVADLHEAHIARVYTEGGAVRSECTELIERVQLLGRGEGLERVNELRREWGERREALDEEFLDELRLILTSEQEQRWSIVERELRRMDEIGGGRMAGESVDVIMFAQKAGVDIEGGQVASILDRYARAMDSALRSRASFFEDNPREEVSELLETDPERAARIFERARAARMEVRDLNRRYIGEVASAVGGDTAEELMEMYYERCAGWSINRASVAGKAIDGAKNIEGLTPKQIAELDKIEERYEQKKIEWIERYAKVLFDVEEGTTPIALERALQGMPSDERPYQGDMQEWETERARLAPLARIWEDRLDLERRTRREVEKMLTIAQQNKMPLLIDQASMSYGQVYGTESYFGM